MYPHADDSSSQQFVTVSVSSIKNSDRLIPNAAQIFQRSHKRLQFLSVLGRDCRLSHSRIPRHGIYRPVRSDPFRINVSQNIKICLFALLETCLPSSMYVADTHPPAEHAVKLYSCNTFKVPQESLLISLWVHSCKGFSTSFQEIIAARRVGKREMTSTDIYSGFRLLLLIHCTVNCWKKKPYK